MSVASGPMEAPILKKDSSRFYYAGSTRDLKTVISTIGLDYKDSAGKNEWSHLYASNDRTVLNKEMITRQTIPNVKGMGLKDALYLLESMDLRVEAKGKGKVKTQSMEPGAALRKNETITLQLN